MKHLKVDESAGDICYRNLMGDADWANEARLYLDHLINVSINVLDKKFLSQLKSNVHAGFAEVYMAAVCRERLKLKLSHPSDKGLDFFLDDFSCWIECVAPTSGAIGNPNSIPVSEFGRVRTFPEREFLLRMARVFVDKSEKIKNDIEKGDTVKPGQPIVIFISAGGLEDSVAFYRYPKLFDVLLGIGEIELSFDASSSKVSQLSAKTRDFVEKKGTDKTVNVGYFFNSEHAHISAVIYSWANYATPFELEHLGRDFHLLHNPYAKNKLALGVFACGKEYVVESKGNIDGLKLHRVFDEDFK